MSFRKKPVCRAAGCDFKLTGFTHFPANASKPEDEHTEANIAFSKPKWIPIALACREL